MNRRSRSPGSQHTCLRDVGFATKPKLATRMIARAIAASVPFKWVAGDTVYGIGDIEQQLRRAGKGYVLGVSSAHAFQSWGKRPPVAGKAARHHPDAALVRLEAPVGGSRNQRTAATRLVLSRTGRSRGRGSSTVQMMVCGHAVSWSVVASPMKTSPFSPPGARQKQPLKRWLRSKAIDGRSRTALKPRKTSSGSITTRADPGMAGTVMCPW